MQNQKFCHIFVRNNKDYNKGMETTTAIRIERPSKALIAFIEKAQQQKKERMKKMRENFLKTQGA